MTLLRSTGLLEPLDFCRMSAGQSRKVTFRFLS
jgi:hypothetical protein